MQAEFSVDIENANIYQGDLLVLSNVQLKLKKGELVYLIGQTGSGKSSLLKTLYGDLKPKDIKGNVAGFSLEKLKRKQIPHLRRKLGIVFQDFQLLSDRTVYDNLYFALKACDWKDKSKIKQRIEEVLVMVNLEHKGYKMPHQLSGGEQQRAGIARALLNNPELILADEPTGNLDPRTSEEIMKLLFDICNSGKSVIIATHDTNILSKFSSRTVECKEGKLIQVQD